jgi:predicted GIY-YIG superfamily endonuclease
MHSYTIPEMHPFDPNAKRSERIPKAYDLTKWPTFDSAPVGNHRNNSQRSVLYRFYDADRNPLYIGITTNPLDRWQSHRASQWWPIARFVSLEPVPPATRLEHERQAILAERPRFNVLRPKTPIAMRLRLDVGTDAIVAQLRDRLLPEDFAALVAAFKAEPDASTGSAA